MLIRQHCDNLLLKISNDTKLYKLFNVLLHHGSYNSKRLTKDKIPSYSTKNILKLSHKCCCTP